MYGEDALCHLFPYWFNLVENQQLFRGIIIMICLAGGNFSMIFDGMVVNKLQQNQGLKTWQPNSFNDHVIRMNLHIFCILKLGKFTLD